MAVVQTAVQTMNSRPPPPPPSRAPPPPPQHGSKPKPPAHRPPPPKRQPPPPSKKARSPPPPPKGPPPVKSQKRSLDLLSPSSSSVGNKTTPRKPQQQPPKKQRRSPESIRVPSVMRDVDVFEKKHQVGEGTYGSVFVARDRASNEIVALKRINTEQEENGFPITALREVKILKALHHDNIVKLKECVTSKEQGAIPKNVFMVMEYMEYDLTGVLETPEIRLTQDHVKSWAQQLLMGCHYMHINKVIHRDLKASNLLINRKGELKIADWGLARSWNSEMTRLTNKVITLWYRPPELLLGCSKYTPKIDMWSVGCIIAEMFRRTGFLKGADEKVQLDLIFRTCGHPTKEKWPDIEKKCRLWKQFKPSSGVQPFPDRLTEALRSKLPHPKWMTDEAVKMISKLMEMNPDRRWSALEALDANYFFEDPIVKRAKDLAMKFAVPSVHEMDCRLKHEAKVAQYKSKLQQRQTQKKHQGQR